MAGIETLAIDVSSTTMNVAADSANVPATRLAPVSGAGASRRRGGRRCTMRERAAVVVVMIATCARARAGRVRARAV